MPEKHKRSARYWAVFKETIRLALDPSPVKVKKIEPDPDCTCKKLLGLPYGDYCQHCQERALRSVLDSFNEVVKSFSETAERVAERKGLKSIVHNHREQGTNSE